jgi:phosphohistidine phosphatase
MRHGHAVAAGVERDEKRPLSPEGQKQAQCAGRAMALAGFRPDAIWHSPYLRAEQTAAAIADFFPDARRRVSPDWVPHGHARALVEELLENAPDRLLVVSHLPLLPAVVAELLSQTRSLDFSTATLAHMILPSTRTAHFPGALVGLYAGEALRRWGDQNLEAGDEA